MFDLFGRNRKSLKDMMNELDEMINSVNHEFSSSTNEESQIKEGSDENSEWKTETYTSPNGMFRYVITTTYGNPKKIFKKESDEISLLKKELEDCVEKQEFERAVEVRDKIKKLEKNQDDINKLQTELNEAISKQDFESAIKLRDKLNKLKS
jgi:excinuclease UvrABC helicase subunit UvrB